MRIVGGTFKGRIFNPNKKFSARPTTDVAKEALFNILANRIDFSGLKVLDLFSGPGSIGYEFISRGASEVTFVDKEMNHIRFIQEVTEKLKITNAKIIHNDAFRFLKFCRQQFDVVFCDPPFDLLYINEIPETVFESGILHESSLFILEHSRDYDFSKLPHFFENRKYGKVNFSFFRP